jgi:Fe-S oxidoreductase
MQHELYTCEMMDKAILDCTKDQLHYQKNRSYLQDDPKALLMLECRAHSKEDLSTKIEELQICLQNKTDAYAFPLIKEADIPLIFELRKAGLGLLSLVKGDKKPVACVEDTAVALDDFAEYIEEFSAAMQKYDQQAVYYAHAGAGELHIRPKINLKNVDEVKDMASLAYDITLLVKKFNGSISGEHGDGQLRASFLPDLLGSTCYQALIKTKNIFDHKNILNPGKIVNAPGMTENLRYADYQQKTDNYSIQHFYPNLLSEAEKCNGSGDCRKSSAFGGVMCPSFQVTNDEQESTRARANALREFLSDQSSVDHLALDDVLEVFQNCVSCKACVSECPSSVDAASFKSELLYRKHKQKGFSLSNYLIANNYELNKAVFSFRKIINYLQKNHLTGGLLKKVLKFHSNRELPELAKNSMKKWLMKKQFNFQKHQKGVFLFVDEFTDLYEYNIGKAAVEILDRLGYNVYFTNHVSSGRAEISKGYLEKAKKLANKNVNLLSTFISADQPLIGIEPSAILSFRDDYKRLADDQYTAAQVAKNTYLFEEFIAQLISNERLSTKYFTTNEKQVKIHVHCHQKALSNTKVTFDMLNFPQNYKASIIVSSCCGMAGSYGLEKENYEMSMKMGENQLFPSIRKSGDQTIIAANGFSCRHQIKDGTSRIAKHPIQVFREALV